MFHKYKNKLRIISTIFLSCLMLSEVSAQSAPTYSYQVPIPTNSVTPTPTPPSSGEVQPSEPNAYLALSTNSAAFGMQQTGSTSSSIEIVVTNTSSQTLAITGISIGSGINVFNQSNNCGTPLGAGESCIVSVAITPTAQGTFNGSLLIGNNSPAGTIVVPLSGVGAPNGTGTISLSETSINFGMNFVPTETAVQITNTSASNVTITLGAFPKGWARGMVANVDCVNRTLAPNQTCEFYVALVDTYGDGVYTGKVPIIINQQSVVLLPVYGELMLNPPM